MSQDHETEPAVISKASDVQEQVYRQIRRRLFRGLNYLSIYVFIIIVYGGALLTDYLLFALISWLLQEDIQRYQLVADWFDYARIGLALLLIICAVTHGLISTYTQVKLDIELSREGEEK
jgi:hypothetical protein